MIKNELNKISKEFGNKRRSDIVDMPIAKQIAEEDMLPSEPVSIVLSEKGWIRAGKGHQINPSTLQYKTGDSYLVSLQTETNKDVILLDSGGRSFSIANTGLPSAKSLGNPLSTMISPVAGANFIDMFSSSDNRDRVIASKEGYGFICPASEFITKQKKGKAILNCSIGSALKSQAIDEQDMIIIATKIGHVLAFGLSELPSLRKGKGNKMISLTDGDYIVSITPFKSGNALLVLGENKEERWTQANISQHINVRGRKGKKVAKTFGELKDIIVTE